MLEQLLTNKNSKAKTADSIHEVEENLNEDIPKDKQTSSIDAEVIKGIRTQIVPLAQRDNLKKAGMTRPYPME